MLEINVLHRTTVQSRGCKAVTVTHLTTFPLHSLYQIRLCVPIFSEKSQHTILEERQSLLTSEIRRELRIKNCTDLTFLWCHHTSRDIRAEGTGGTHGQLQRKQSLSMRCEFARGHVFWWLKTTHQPRNSPVNAGECRYAGGDGWKWPRVYRHCATGRPYDFILMDMQMPHR